MSKEDKPLPDSVLYLFRLLGTHAQSSFAPPPPVAPFVGFHPVVHPHPPHLVAAILLVLLFSLARFPSSATLPYSVHLCASVIPYRPTSIF